MPEQPKILIIDDYDLNIKLCRAILQKLKAMVARFLERPSKRTWGAA
jgi:CheY-like chemotaxis protein